MRQLTGCRLALINHLGNKFDNPIREWFKQRNDVRFYGPDTALTIEGLANAYRWADVILSMWCAEPVQMLSSLGRGPTLLSYCRSYEALSPEMMRAVRWPVVDGLVFIAPHVREMFAQAAAGKITEMRGGVQLPVIDVRNFYTSDVPERPLPTAKPGNNVGFVATLGHKKGVELALQALAELPGFTLHVAGNHAEPRFAEYWRHAVATLGLSTRVVMHGWVDDIPGWFRSVPINYVLSTSPWEGCPNNVIEAMAHGIKPLVHNWPGATEMFGPELVWSRLDELPGMMRDGEYLAAKYQDQVRERFSRERIMPVVEDFVARMAGDGTIRGQFNRTRELVEMEDAQCLVPAT